MKNFTFYEDNKITGKHQKSTSTILREFYATEESKWDMPFERLILNFMGIKYGSFDILTDSQWKSLYEKKDIYRHKHEKPKPQTSNDRGIK